MRARVPVVSLLAALALSAPASAEPVTVHLVLTVGDTINPSQATPIFGTVHPGDTLQAQFTYDPLAPDQLPANPTEGAYTGARGTIAPLRLNGQSALTVLAGFSEAPPNHFGGFLTGTFPGFDFLEFDFGWQRPSGLTDALPRSAAEIRSYGVGSFNLVAYPTGESDDQTGAFAGTVRVADVAQTPEPASLLLLGSGAALLARRRRS